MHSIPARVMGGRVLGAVSSGRYLRERLDIGLRPTGTRRVLVDIFRKHRLGV